MQWFRKPGRRLSPDRGGRGLYQRGQRSFQGRVSGLGSSWMWGAGRACLHVPRVLLPLDRQRGWKAGLGQTGSPHLEAHHRGLSWG